MRITILMVICLIVQALASCSEDAGHQHTKEEISFFTKMDSCLSEEPLLSFYTEVLNENEVLQKTNSKSEFVELIKLLDKEGVLIIPDRLKQGDRYGDYFWSLAEASICVQDIYRGDTFNESLLVEEVYLISTLTAHPDYIQSTKYVLDLISDIRKETFANKWFQKYLKMKFISLYIEKNVNMIGRTLPPPED